MKQGWEIVQLGSLCEIQLGKTPHRKTDQFWDKEKESNNVWLSISDMRHGAVMHDSKEYVSDLGAEIFKITPKGTLMLSFKLTLGRVAFAGSDLLTNEAIASLINLDNKIDQRFLFYYFTFFDWDEATKGDEKVKGKTLNKAKLKKLPIIVPPLEEQKQIVAKLDQCFEAIDKARANAVKNLENAKELFQSKLNDIFSQKGEGWVEKKLGDVCSLIKRGIPPKYIETGGIQVVNQKCIRNHKVNLTLARRHNIVLKSVSQEKLIQIGDVLVNSTGVGTLGRVAQVRDSIISDTTVDTHVTIVRPIPDLFFIDFFGYVLIKIEDEITKSGEGASGQTELARTKLQNNFIVSYPTSLEEQKQIVKILDSLKKQTQSLESKYQQELNSLEELKKSILQKAFEGEL
jgi:type I restriction enzyme, S subunit